MAIPRQSEDEETALTGHQLSQTAAGVNHQPSQEIFGCSRSYFTGQMNPVCEIQQRKKYLRQSKRPKRLLLEQVNRKTHEGAEKKDLLN